MARRAVWVVCAALVGVLVLPAMSHAIDYRGKTGQGKGALVRAPADGQDPRITIGWTARCRKPGVSWRDATIFRPPYRGGSAGDVGDDGAYRRRSGRVVAIITIHMRARRVSGHRWQGTFRAHLVVRRRGRVIDRCRMLRTRWRATIPRAGIDLVGDESESLSGGGSYSFRSPDDMVTAVATRELIQVRAGGYIFLFSDASPTGLRPGRFVGGLGVNRRNRHCGSESKGEFTITKLSFGRRGKLRNLELTFEHHCGDAPEALRGSISYRR